MEIQQCPARSINCDKSTQRSGQLLPRVRSLWLVDHEQKHVKVVVNDSLTSVPIPQKKMPRPCQKKCCHKIRYNAYEQQATVTRRLRCNIDRCGACFKHESVLRMHQIKEHRWLKPRPVAVIKPLVKMVPNMERKAKVILKDILAKENYSLGEHDRFVCPVCDKSTTAKAMYVHLSVNHKTLLKLVKPKIKCSDCNTFVHPNNIVPHKRSKFCNDGELLSLCY